jgi:hypothetical protein
MHQGRFEIPRGIPVVPRAEDTANEGGLAIFEGPGAVPLGAFI